MALTVRSLDTDDPRLDDLVQRSHQTSLYVTKAWRKAFPPVKLLGAFQGETLLAAVFVEKPSGTPPFVGYRGLLLTRREQVPVINALLQEIEGTKAVLVNAPAMVDVRPFFWRWPPALWRTDIRYTMFLYPDSRPFQDLPQVSFVEGQVGECPIVWVDEETERAFQTILDFPTTWIKRSDTATLVGGTDAQGRGYYIAGWGQGLPALTRTVASQFPSFDLGGINSPASANHKRVYGGQLRTIYKVWL